MLPDAYAHYRRPITGALTVFLDGLPEAHQIEALEEQAALPPDATMSERLAQLARTCPVLHKLGQTLARDRRIRPELRLQLQKLESLPPTIPLRAIRKILARELGRLDRLGLVLEPPALAEASVAVVIPFRQHGPGQREGVFKILKPGIEERLEQELALTERVGAYLDEQCEDLGIARLDYREAFEGLADQLQHELRLDLEQRHLAIAHAAYAGEARIHIPALFDCCTPRVTAMERIYGEKVTDHRFDGADEQRRLAEMVIRAVMVRPFLSMASDALFHGDPHAGNLLLTREHRLAILDWSLATTVSEDRRVAFVQIVIGGLTIDAERIVDALLALAGPQGIELAAARPVIDAALGRLRQGQFPGLIWMTELLDAIAQTARPRFGSDLVLLRKTLHSLEGVVADIGADRRCLDSVLLSAFFAHMAIEWPFRWFADPFKRTFATRLSNADLAGVLATLPLTATSFWLGRGAASQDRGDDSRSMIAD